MKHLGFVKKIIFFTLIICIPIIFIASNVFPQTSTWSSPQKIINETISGDWNLPPQICRYPGKPDIAIDSQGNWHIVYYEMESNPSYDFVKREIKYLSRGMSTPVTVAVASPRQYFNRPSIALDSQNNPHIVYEQYDDFSPEDPGSCEYSYVYKIMYVNNISGVWSSPQQIVSAMSGGSRCSLPMIYRYVGEPSLAIDSYGNWHIVYYDSELNITSFGNTQRYEIRYLRSGMTSPIVVATSAGYEQDFSYPSIALDSQDNSHITYGFYDNISSSNNMYSYTYGIMYVDNFSSPQQIASITNSGDWIKTLMYAGEPNIVIDSQDNWHIVYYEAQDIKYLVKGMTTSISISTASPSQYFDYPSIALDSQDNGHVVYGQFEYFFPGGSKYHNECSIIYINSLSSVEFFDGSDFSAGREITNDAQKLLQEGTAMEGAVADGVTRLLIRLPVENNVNNLVTLSLAGSSNPAENGFLYSLDNPDNTQKFQQSIQVYPVIVNNKKYIFAGYRAPDNFTRQGVEEDKTNSERKVTLTIQSNDSSLNLTQDIEIVRPPLILVHGLWSGPEMWDGFKIMLKNKIPDLQIYTIDYQKKNASHFNENKNVPYSCDGDSVVKAKTDLKSKGIAMVQADVLGHSMGGILARIWAGQPEEIYLRSDNFYRGDINKLITLDSPHKGSFLADFGVLTLEIVKQYKPDIYEAFIFLGEEFKYFLNKGALQDLMTISDKIKVMNSREVAVLAHVIAGDFIITEDFLDNDDMGFLYSFIKNVENKLDLQIIPDRSDLVVSLDSQTGGLSASQLKTFNHHHCAAVNKNVEEEVIDLLSTDDSSLFSNGFPVKDLSLP